MCPKRNGGWVFFHLCELKEWGKTLFCPSFQKTFEEMKGNLEATNHVTSWSISSCKVSSLNHEVFDHTMKFTSFVSISSLRKWNNSLNEYNIQFYTVIWKYTCGEWPDFTEYTTTGDKYWQETSETETQVNAARLHCHKADIIQVIKAIVFTWLVSDHSTSTC